jgi:CheY-like chemotaxis protein
MRPLRILIADDDLLTLEILKLMFEVYGDVTAVTDGVEAIDTYETEASKYHRSTPYDFVCLDIHMPGRSGLEVLELIRNFEEDNHFTSIAKIAVVTSDRDPALLTLALCKLCDEYCTKPLSTADVKNLLESCELI